MTPKRFLITAIACMMMLAGYSNNNANNNKMNTLSFNEQQAAALSAMACHEARGDQSSLAIAINEGLDAGVTVSQIKEALSQLYAYTGFPRSLNALGTLQKVLQERKTVGKTSIEGKDATPLPRNYNALKQGTEVQTKLSGQPFNYTFCPAEDYYLKAHLFGDIFARDNLTHADRELITVSALAGLEGVEPQLAAHVRGARNMGLTDAQLLAIPKALLAKVGKAQAQRAAIAIQQMGITDPANAQMVKSPAGLNSNWPVGDPNDAYAQFFIGQSYLNAMGGGMFNVTFEPGCRNNWHIHHKQVQVLVCVYGRGWYQEWGKPAVELKPGVVIEIPEGAKHWHGAAADSWMQHLTYHKDVQEGASNEWLEPVTDDQYKILK
jgi:quercetin dioxygenase-like cupin family protein/alkylhydroperoxidase/carboxymuconolactone decarboxylase family protein YurZ